MTDAKLSMILQRIDAPVMRCALDGPRSIAPAVEALIGPRGLGGSARSLTPEILDMIGIASMEVLHSVFETGDGAAREASAELWVESTLAVIAVGHAGPALPRWLIANWHRAEEPGMLDASAGWGWLLVREAFDGVSAARCGNREMLFLEKRLGSALFS